jgi:hypothetical protein
MALLVLLEQLAQLVQEVLWEVRVKVVIQEQVAQLEKQAQRAKLAQQVPRVTPVQRV